MNETIVQFGQTGLIATGVVVWTLGIVVYRFKTRNRKYHP